MTMYARVGGGEFVEFTDQRRSVMSLEALNEALQKANDSMAAAQTARTTAKAATDAALAAQQASTTADAAYATDRAAALQAFLAAFPDALPNAERVRGMVGAGTTGLDPAVIAVLLQLLETASPYALQLLKLLLHLS